MAETVIEREFARHLPFVHHEEAIAPFGDPSADFRSRCAEGLGQSKYEIGRRIAAQHTVKGKRAARAVDGCATGCQSAEFHSSHDVVRAVAPTELFRELIGAVILVPVGSAVAESIEAGVTAVRNAG